MDLSELKSICIFGDSIVYAHTDPMRGGWPGRLKQALTEANDAGAVYALGIPGNTLRDVADRFDGEAAARKPDLVIIAVGTADSPNDFSEPTPLAEFQEGYGALLEKVRKVTPRVLVLTPPNIDVSRATYGFSNHTIELYVNAIKASANNKAVPCVDLFGRLSDQDFDRDGLHPTSAGHEKLYDAVMKTLTTFPTLNTHQPTRQPQ
jgi:lysophospholipase L1-like esterase